GEAAGPDAGERVIGADVEGDAPVVVAVRAGAREALVGGAEGGRAVMAGEHDRNDQDRDQRGDGGRARPRRTGQAPVAGGVLAGRGGGEQRGEGGEGQRGAEHGAAADL